MRHGSPDVTDTELAILQVLWDQPAATRRQIADVLYPDGGIAHYATVQKLLERLEAKGYVRHQRHAGQLTFTAAVDRDGLIKRRLQDVATKLCGGSLTPLVMNLVRAQALNPQELDELRTLIDQLRRQGKSRGKSP
jgi:predicted transcriptional regulator